MTHFDLLATDLLVQPNNLLASPTSTAHCWLVFRPLSPSGPPDHFQHHPSQPDPCQQVLNLYQCRGWFSPSARLCILLLFNFWGSCWMIVPTCVGASGWWCCSQAYQLVFSLTAKHGVSQAILTYLSFHPSKMYCSNWSTRMLREIMSKP